MRQLLVIVLLNMVVAGCAVVPDENSSLYAPPRGTRLILKQDLAIPAGQAGVLLQYGKVVAERDRDFYRPSCRLEVNDVRDSPQTVQADEFVARRVWRDQNMTALSPPVRVAMAPSGGPAFLVFRTVFALESARQPQVRQLVCQQWSDPAFGVHVTIGEIRHALGEFMELKLPAGGGE